ncbi:MAG: MoaD/ThiS family protein [Alphaproteobacteria bacterium]|nr:MoaD/ThiS family protein [Alphaproteobacteria bacterium]
MRARSPEAPAAEVIVRLPPVLGAVTGGVREFPARGATLAEAIDDLATRNPALGLHIFDETHAVRRNVLFVHEGVVVRAREMAGRRLAPGDEILIANALAGG